MEDTKLRGQFGCNDNIRIKGKSIPNCTLILQARLIIATSLLHALLAITLD